MLEFAQLLLKVIRDETVKQEFEEYDFKVFSVISAFCQQMLHMEPTHQKAITEFMTGNIDAIELKLNSAKDYYLKSFQQQDSQQTGSISLEDFELEMRAGRADPDIVISIIDSLQMQGKSSVWSAFAWLHVCEMVVEVSTCATSGFSVLHVHSNCA